VEHLLTFSLLTRMAVYQIASARPFKHRRLAARLQPLVAFASIHLHRLEAWLFPRGLLQLRNTLSLLAAAAQVQLRVVAAVPQGAVRGAIAALCPASLLVAAHLLKQPLHWRVTLHTQLLLALAARATQALVEALAAATPYLTLLRQQAAAAAVVLLVDQLTRAHQAVLVEVLAAAQRRVQQQGRQEQRAKVSKAATLSPEIPALVTVVAAAAQEQRATSHRGQMQVGMLEQA
jgi:hypothetical protein